MLVYSLVSAALTLILIVLAATRLFGGGDAPYFAGRRRERVAARGPELAAVVVEAHRGAVAGRPLGAMLRRRV